MKFHLIHNDSAGETHLSEQVWLMHEGEFTPPSPAGYLLSDTFEAESVMMMHHPAGYRDEWHCAPHPVLGTVTSGNVRIEVSCGDQAILRPGDQFLALDLDGAGHKMEEATQQSYDLALVVLKSIPNLPIESLT